MIHDLHALDGVKDAKKRQFRSVLSIPVRVGGPSGGSIAVLNLDVVKPHFFNEALVERKVLPLVTPALNLLEMVLLLRDPEAEYVFNQ